MAASDSREGAAHRGRADARHNPDQVIWADRFEGDLAELFELQDRIAMRVVTAIAPHLRERELSRALRKHPASMTAYDLTLAGARPVLPDGPCFDCAGTGTVAASSIA